MDSSDHAYLVSAVYEIGSVLHVGGSVGDKNDAKLNFNQLNCTALLLERKTCLNTVSHGNERVKFYMPCHIPLYKLVGIFISF